MYKLISPLLILLMVSFAGAIGVGDPAPDFTLEKLGGGDFTLSENLGKIIFIFWIGYN